MSEKLNEKYLLKDSSLYLDKWTITPIIARDHYKCLLNEYFTYITKTQNDFSVSSNSMFKYIVITGMSTLTHIFKIIMVHTNNIDAALYHSQTAILLYIEFIVQITQNSSIFLKLSIRDAIIYVYKKTIFTLKERMTDTHCNVEIDDITKVIHSYHYDISMYICNNLDNKLTENNLIKIQDILNENR